MWQDMFWPAFSIIHSDVVAWMCHAFTSSWSCMSLVKASSDDDEVAFAGYLILKIRSAKLEED